MKHLYAGLILCAWCSFNATAQDADSLQTKELNEVIIRSKRLYDMERLPEVDGTYLWSGKKTEVINFQSLDANIAEKTGRQIFAKVPGVFVYDMDGTGNQMNISTRGLDPHRGWEFNVRKDGVLTNSDMYGYPASHYSMPMESIDRIQLVRGTASLQYGAQFGGMLNYISKGPDTTSVFTFESINTVGSFGMFSTYNAASGRVGKFDYYVYVNKRVADGYRKNSHTDYDAESVVITYRPSAGISITGEVSRSNYVYQIPGPLNDTQFNNDPTQSTRSRNFYNPDIYVPSLRLKARLGTNTDLHWTLSAVIGDRNSVQFDKPADVPDTINHVTGAYAPRQVDIDNFNSYTSELRVLHRYSLFHLPSKLAAGVQVMSNNMQRRQMGVGSTGTDFDLELQQEGWGRNMHYKTKNLALFLENNISVTSRFTITPGVRFETGKTRLSGDLSYANQEALANTIEHRFPLFGVNAQFNVNANQQIYGGWSQAYRPVLFKDIVPGSTYERSDKNLDDAFGYNMELGYRGHAGAFRWDVTGYMIRYNNRMGTLAMTDDDDQFYLYRTNIGDSQTKGIEVFGEYTFIAGNISFSLSTATAYTDARYQDASVRSGSENVDIDGNRVESTPRIISRNSLNLRIKRASFTFLYSYTAESFADALNTKTPPSNGSVGLVPSYGLLDFNSTLYFRKGITLRVNINNITDKQYFTKRPQFYPGPGIWPSDGRSFTVTVGVKV